MRAELTPLAPEDAIRALQARGANLSPSFNWQEVYAEEHAKAFTFAKSAGFDVMNDVFGALETSLKEGKTLRDFAKSLTPVLQQKGWWRRKLAVDPNTGEQQLVQLGSPRRLELIFNVNMRVSYAAGHWANFERNRRARPFLRYVCILDGRTRPEHRKRHNLCLPVDHPYWDTWAPPCGWNCRCTLQAMSQAEVDRMRDELIFEPPADDLIPWTNKVTGEIRNIPRGIDPGWDHNPGKAGFQAFDAAERVANAPPELSATVNQDLSWLVKPLNDQFADWFDTAAKGGPIDRSTVVTGFLSSAVIQSLNKLELKPASGAITVNQATVMHMLRDAKAQAGKSVSAEALRQLPMLIAFPRAVLLDKRDGSLLYVFDGDAEGQSGKLVVRLDFKSKARPAGSKPVSITTNAVRTAGKVDADRLRDRNFYIVLEGSV